MDFRSIFFKEIDLLGVHLYDLGELKFGKRWAFIERLLIIAVCGFEYSCLALILSLRLSAWNCFLICDAFSSCNFSNS